MITILILIAVYIASAIILYRWTQKAYSEEGVYWNLNIELSNIFVIFCPFANTICAIFSFFDSPYKEKEYKTPKNYNKLFKIKK